MDPELTQKVEAVLFACGRFIDATRIAELIEASPKNVENALKGLRDFYASQDTALRIVEEDGAWKIHVRDEFLEVVSKVVSDTEVSGPVLETLAVIAWRSPILQSEVINIRGTNAYEHVKELTERAFIKKEPEGRSYRLRITDKFFEYFDIEGRDDIKKMFQEVEEEHRKKELEVELAQKRLEMKMREAQVAQSGEEEVVEKALPDKKMNIDDLDALLERSAKTREKIAEDMKAMRKPEASDEKDESDEQEDADDDQDITLEEAKAKRERAEEDAEKIAEEHK